MILINLHLLPMMAYPYIFMQIFKGNEKKIWHNKDFIKIKKYLNNICKEINIILYA